MFSSTQGYLGILDGRENSVNRSSESLVYLTVNTVCNQQLVLLSVSTVRVDFFPFPAPLERGYLDVASRQHVIHITLQ